MKQFSIYLSILLISIITLVSCHKEKEHFLVFNGEFNQEAIKTIKSFENVIIPVIDSMGITQEQFSELHTRCQKWNDPLLSPTLSSDEAATFVTILLEAMNRLYRSPDYGDINLSLVMMAPVFQKIIPLSEVENYLSNRYRDIRGRVDYIGDVHATVYSILEHGLWMNYLGYLDSASPLSDALSTGYAVIRYRSLWLPSFAFCEGFLSIAGDKLNLESFMYNKKGISNHFPTGISGIAYGQIPEFFNEYDPSVIKGEIYEITPHNRAILRGEMTNIGWKTSEGYVETRSASNRNNVFNDSICNGLTVFLQGHKFPAYLSPKGVTLIMSNSSPLTEELGFKFDNAGFYIKQMSSEEVIASGGYAFTYTHTCIDGDTLQVRTINPQGYAHLTTSDPVVAKRQDMMAIDIGTFRKIVPAKLLGELFDLIEE